MPAPFEKKLGVHPMVCCPKVVDESSICFPSDPWCPTYEPPEYSPAPPAAADYPDYEDGLYEDFDPVDTDRLAPLESTSLGGLSFTRGLIYPKEWNNCGINADGSRSCVSLKKCPQLAQSSTAPDDYLRACGFNTSDNQMSNLQGFLRQAVSQGSARIRASFAPAGNQQAAAGLNQKI